MTVTALPDAATLRAHPVTMTASPGAATLRAHRNHVAGRALGCYVHVATADPTDLTRASRLATDLLDRVDHACSRFRADSDLVRANAAAGRWVRVDPLLATAVAIALQAARDTGGLVDPTLGHSLTALGYDRDFTIVPGSSADPVAVPAPGSTGGWRDVEVDLAGAVRVPPGQLLDLGATAKAWAADLVADAVHRQTGGTVVVSLGGDVRVAGSAGDGWPIEITERPPDANTTDAPSCVAAPAAPGRAATPAEPG